MGSNGGWRVLRRAAVVMLAGHGLVHLLGVSLLWRLGEPGGLRYADVHPEPGTPLGIIAGVVWLVSGLLFVVGAVLVAKRSPRWRPVALVAVLASGPVLRLNIDTAFAVLVVDAAVILACALTGRRAWPAGDRA